MRAEPAAVFSAITAHKDMGLYRRAFENVASSIPFCFSGLSIFRSHVQLLFAYSFFFY